MTQKLSIALVLCFTSLCAAQRGSFNAREFVERMDKNKNGKLERDEVDGRAEGWLKRAYPDANFDKGVSVRKMADKMQSAHEERMKKYRGSERDRDRSDNAQTSDIDLTALVPGFGEVVELPPVTSFGEISGAAEIRKEDREKAKWVMEKYDKNRNGQLEMTERGRNTWSDDPYKYDLDKNGKISRSELARRYAIHRVDEKSRREKGLPSRYQKRRGGDRDGNDGPQIEVIAGRATPSYVSDEKRLPEGLPDWFAAKDKNNDGQLSMAEFLAELTAEEVEKFTGMDTNNDGVLVARELGVEPANDEEEKKTPERVASSRTAGRTAKSRTANSSSSKSSSASPAADEKYRTYAQGRVKKYDTNGDGVLSIEECQAGKPGLVEADKDKNGKITVDEVASFYQRLYKR